MRIEISKRISALAASATLAMVEKARALRDQGVQVIDFSAGQPDFDTPQHVKEAAWEALKAGDTKYPLPVSGKTPLRTALCDYLKSYCGTAYKPAQICVTVGAKDALHLAFASVLNPGDEVLLPVPYWVSYPEQIRLMGATPVLVKSPPGRGGKIGPAELKAALTPRTRILILNSPSNPTGAVYSRAEIAALADALRGTDVLVVSDEIYHRLVFGAEPFTSVAAVDGMYERTITVNGFSKSFAMTGWRLGYAAGPEPIIAAMSRLQGQTTSGATSFVQTAAVAALTGDQTCVDRMRDAYRERGARMHAALNAIAGVRCDKPDGAFYCFPDVSGTYLKLGVSNADEFAETALERAHVAVVSGTPFGTPTHVRLSFATSMELIDQGVQRLARLLSA